MVVRASASNSMVHTQPDDDAYQAPLSSSRHRGGESHAQQQVIIMSSSTATSVPPRCADAVVQPYSSTQRSLMTSLSSSAPVVPFFVALLDSDASRDHARTYWKPDALRGDVGLLETLHRRADNHMMHLLVSSRPADELRHNFSVRNGDCISLDDDLFKLSKTHFALRHLERVDDHVTVDGHALKSAMRENLPQLHQDDYYLVSYRDYSTWAVSQPHLRPHVKRDSTLGPKYVTQYFAIRVGQNPGSFLPITEAQYLFGCEVLEQQRHSATPAQIASKAINLFALNTDQFRSTSAVVGRSGSTTESSADGHPRGAAAAASSGYIAPSAWDWTPAAIERRVNHFLDQQYRAVGRLVVKGVLVGFCLYLFVQFVRRGTGLTSPPPSSARHGRRGGRVAHRNSSVDDASYDSTGSAVGNVVRSIFVTGPKEFFDFILGG